MTVTVGTDVYISVANADTYWSNKNNSTWSAASTANKEKALREATQFIDGAFSFIGTQNPDNVLAFPRYDVYITTGNFAGISYDSTTIPPQVEDACCELALEALSARIMAVESRGGLVKREKVDVVEVEYMDWAPSGKTYGFAAMILKPLTIGSKTIRKLSRT